MKLRCKNEVNYIADFTLIKLGIGRNITLNFREREREQLQTGGTHCYYNAS